MVRSILRSGQPTDLAERLRTDPDHEHFLRSVANHDIQGRVDMGRVNLIKDFFTSRAIRTYNSIPAEIREIDKDDQFKRKLKEYLQPGIKIN